MKLFFALSLAVCFASVYCAWGVDDHVLNDCITESNANKAIFDEAMKNKKLPEKTREVEAVIACTMIKEELLGEDGKFTKEYLDAKGTKACREITGKDNGEIAYNAVDCLIKNKPAPAAETAV